LPRRESSRDWRCICRPGRNVAEVRQRLMEQFGVCLDRMAAGEPPPRDFAGTAGLILKPDRTERVGLKGPVHAFFRDDSAEWRGSFAGPGVQATDRRAGAAGATGGTVLINWRRHRFRWPRKCPNAPRRLPQRTNLNCAGERTAERALRFIRPPGARHADTGRQPAEIGATRGRRRMAAALVWRRGVGGEYAGDHTGRRARRISSSWRA